MIPPVIILIRWIFHGKNHPVIKGYPHDFGNLQISEVSQKAQQLRQLPPENGRLAGWYRTGRGLASGTALHCSAGFFGDTLDLKI